MLKHKALFLGLTAVLVTGAARGADGIPNWPAPATYTPARSSGARTLSDITNPLPFVGITPCRQFDIRPATLSDNTPMAITLTGAPCGIPASAGAVSLNITVFAISGAGGNGVFKVGTANPPVTAWINYPPTETQRGNAGALPVNGSGQIWVQVNQGAGSIQLTVDVNGYYPAAINAGEFFEVTGNVAAGVGVIEGFNNSTVPGAFGVLGQINSTSPGDDSTGVRGINNGTFIEGKGVWGSHGGLGIGVLGTTVGGFGVLGTTSATSGGTAVAGSSNGGVGVSGVSLNTAGVQYGVIGQCATFANGSAGVRGFDGSAYQPAGVIVAGVEGSSQDAAGVYGISRFLGVEGALFNTSDAFAAFGLLGTTFGTAGDTTTGPWAVFAGGTFGATGAKHFVEPDPREPNGVILYSSLEGREVGTYFRGTARTSGGSAVVEIPEDFGIVTDENGLTVQLTPVGAFAQMYVESQDLNQIVVHSSRDVTFHYLVQGVRRAFKDFKPLAKGYEFMPRSADERMPLYLTEEARRRLIANGTYNADGTVNMTTAERAGWTKIWADRKAEAEAAAKKAREAAANQFQFQH